MQLTQQQIHDATLIQAYLGGDDKAIETLVFRYKDKIYTAIYMIVRDRYLAEDIFQETFLKLIRTLRSEKYAEQGKFLPWAMRVAHNLCMDHFRKHRQKIPVVTQDGRDVLSLMFCEKDQPGHFIEQKQVCENVRRMIERLPDEQREVVVLRIYAELSFKQIANLTGISINTALGRMRYALINLRKMIEKSRVVLR